LLPNGGRQVSDFVVFYMGGKVVNSADVKHIYDPAVQLRCFNDLIYPIHVDKPFYFLHTPQMFCLMSVLARLPIERAFLVWIVFSLVSAGLTFFLLLRRCRSYSFTTCLLMELAVAASFPTMLSIRMGQLSALLLALICIFCFGLLKGRDIVAGLALAALTIKPHYAVFFAVLALAQKRWKLICVALVSFVALMTWIAYIVGIDNILFYPLIATHADTTDDYLGISAAGMISIRGVTQTFLPDFLRLPVAFVFMFAAVAFCYFIWNRRIWRPSGEQPVQFWLISTTCLLMITFSPHSHFSDLLLLAPAVLTLEHPHLADMFSQKRALTVRLWSALLIFYPLIPGMVVFLSALIPIQPFLTIFAINVLMLALAVRQLQTSKADIIPVSNSLRSTPTHATREGLGVYKVRQPVHR
jgi:hypothetical protein